MYRLSDVSLSFGSLKVLENFSAEFGCNQFTCLFGPSGIGKSTILNLLSGLIKPDSGEVSVTNATIGYVFQDTRLLPWCTVRENMEIGLYAANVPKIRRDNIVNSMIERLGLAGFTDYYPNQLSGGMKQRVALGRAFVVDPQLLLLDEPFSGLDEVLKMEMRNLLNELISWHPVLRYLLPMTSWRRYSWRIRYCCSKKSPVPYRRSIPSILIVAVTLSIFKNWNRSY